MSDSQEILVVASKVKSYVKSRHGLNTSATVIECLSEKIRTLLDEAAGGPQKEGRKTLMGRDIQ